VTPLRRDDISRRVTAELLAFHKAYAAELRRQACSDMRKALRRRLGTVLQIRRR
jgi:hypothetical protein